MKRKLFLIGLFTFFCVVGCSSDEELQKENDIMDTEKVVESSEVESEREIYSTETSIQEIPHVKIHDGKTALDKDWQSAYMEYLVGDGYEEYLNTFTYSLIYVNDDDVPELVMDSGFEAGGCLILTYKDGNVDALQTARLYFTYIEKENLLNNSAGHMGLYYDYIYTIENGKWKEVARGDYSGFEDESNPLMDQNGNYICKEYYWNGSQATHEEYYDRLKEVYDEEKAIVPKNYYPVDEILCILKTGTVSSVNHRYELITGDVTWEEAQELCKKKGGYLATITSVEEFEQITGQISQEEKSGLVFWIGANRVAEGGMPSFYHWVDDRLRDDRLWMNEFWKYWLEGEPSYSGLGEDGQELKEEYVVLLYKRSDGKYYFNDVPNDILVAAPSYQGIVGYICEYDE